MRPVHAPKVAGEVLVAQFHVSFPSPLPPRDNIAPTKPVLVVRHNPDSAVRNATFEPALATTPALVLKVPPPRDIGPPALRDGEPNGA